MKNMPMNKLLGIRRFLTFLSFLLFPLTLNYFSPYVSVAGAMEGIVSGSLLAFLLLFLSGILLGRSWCSWGCPWAAPSEYLMKIQAKPVNRRLAARIRYGIFGVWSASLLLGFFLAGGIRGVDPLYLTEGGISVDVPMKFLTYYMVLFLLTAVTLLVGRRGACQTICWMSPFLVAGMLAGEALRLPRLGIRSQPQHCISCRACDKACPMSIPVREELRDGRIASHDCILCGACISACPKGVLSYGLLTIHIDKR